MGNTIVQLRGLFCCGRINPMPQRRDHDDNALSSGHSAVITERAVGSSGGTDSQDEVVSKAGAAVINKLPTEIK